MSVKDVITHHRVFAIETLGPFVLQVVVQISVGASFNQVTFPVSFLVKVQFDELGGIHQVTHHLAIFVEDVLTCPLVIAQGMQGEIEHGVDGMVGDGAELLVDLWVEQFIFGRIDFVVQQRIDVQFCFGLIRKFLSGLIRLLSFGLMARLRSGSRCAGNSGSWADN